MRTLVKPSRMFLAVLSVALVVTVFTASGTLAQDRNQGRSMVISPAA